MIHKLRSSIFYVSIFLLAINALIVNAQQKAATSTDPGSSTSQRQAQQSTSPVQTLLLSLQAPAPMLHPGSSHQVLGHAKRLTLAHTASVALWRTDGGFVSKMRLKNALVTGPLEVGPVLYMSDGTEYVLTPVNVPPAGVISLNINQLLAQAPPSVMTHISTFGSASLTYRHPSGGHLIATVSMQDTSRSLVLSYPFTESPVSRRRSSGTPTVWEGLWWKRDPEVHGFLAISNSSAQEAQTNIRLVGNDGILAQPKVVRLKAHSTQILSLENVKDGLGTAAPVGGIRVESSGEAGSIAIAGGLLNEKEGYSANLPFVQSMALGVGPVMLGSTGIMVGKPDAMMRFPAETQFTPYLLLRNTTAKSLPIQLQISYMTESAPVSKVISQNLTALETKEVDLADVLHGFGLGDFNGSVNVGVSYTGLPSDLVLASGSVDQTGNYVFEVQPQALSSTHKKLGNYWDLDAGSNSMYSIWNPTDKPQDVLVSLYYDSGKGKYKIPVHVAPQASVMLDLKNIIEANAPDAEGNVFPANTSEGSATIESADGPTGQMNLIVSGAVFNVVTGTCFGCCVPCCGTSDMYLNPSSDSCTVGDTEQFSGEEEDCEGSTFEVSGGDWSSSNTRVATVNSTGLMTAVGSGHATLTLAENIPASSDCGEPLPGECPLTNFVATGPVNVDDFTISDGQTVDDGGGRQL